MFTNEDEDRLRLEIFSWLDTFTDEPWMTRDQLEKDFIFQGQPLRLLGSQQGIWTPKAQVKMRAVLSVISKHDGPYEDLKLDETRTVYKYMGENPNHPSNVSMREAARLNIPFIFFEWVAAGKYIPRYPAYIVEDFPDKLEVVIDYSGSPVFGAIDELAPEEIARSYQERKVRQRMHQPRFRAQVILAYTEKCAICRLNHRELLDAAHIIPDREEHGFATVSNGLALCKIHHTAFDKNMMGISPDLQVHVNQRILQEIDGPMLKYGIQDMHGQKISVPRKVSERPNLDSLKIRFDRFKERA